MTVLVTSPRASQGHHWKAYKALVFVANTNEEVVRWLHEHLGGHIEQIRQRSDRRWRVENPDAEEVLRALKPYLIVKREHARLVLAVRATMAPAGGRPGKRALERREALVAEIRAINRKGPTQEAAK